MIITRGDLRPKFKHIPTGIFALDIAMLGGLPEGLATLGYGWEHCVAETTFLKYLVVDPDTGKVQNCKGGSIRRLWHRFHGVAEKGWGNYQRKQTVGAEFYVMSVNDAGCVIRNRIADVVKTGAQPCYKLRTVCGKFEIEVTGEHRFLTERGYVRLNELQAHDRLFVHDNTHFTGVSSFPRYKTLSVKWYYTGTPKDINGSVFYQHSVPRLTYEAGMNSVSLKTYRAMLNDGRTSLPEGWRTIPEGFEVHHRDEDRTNNDLSNLELVDMSVHRRAHALGQQDKMSFVAVPYEIGEITYVGDRETYDVKCYVPFNNYIAAGFVTHNSGKSTMGYKMIAQAQIKHPQQAAVLLDIEGTYSPEWGAIQGINNEHLVLVQPESGEQALDVAISMIQSQEVSCLMVDSLAALAPRAMLDKSFEDATVGEQARMISRFCVVGQSELIRQRNRGHRVAVYLVNQWRTKIVTRGDPRVLPGGVAQNYWAAIKIDFKNKEEAGRDDQGHQLIDHNDHAFTIKKNKVGVAAREGEFLMVRNPDHPLGQGFVDDARAVITWAKSVGYVGGGGTKQTIRGCDQNFRTLQDMADMLYDKPDYNAWLRQSLIEDYRETKGLERIYL